MNKDGLIYELNKEQQEALTKPNLGPKEIRLREDVARLDGYLKARAEHDRPLMAIPKSRKRKK